MAGFGWYKNYPLNTWTIWKKQSCTLYASSAYINFIVPSFEDSYFEVYTYSYTKKTVGSQRKSLYIEADLTYNKSCLYSLALM